MITSKPKAASVVKNSQPAIFSSTTPNTDPKVIPAMISTSRIGMS